MAAGNENGGDGVSGRGDEQTKTESDASCGDVGRRGGGERAKKTTKTTEYANAVNAWLHQCYYWQSVQASFPYFLMNQMMLLQSNHQLTAAAAASANASAAAGNRRNPSLWRYLFGRRIRNINGTGGTNPRIDPATVPLLTELGGREYKVPRIWKRFTAEFVDFAILFLLKLFFTFIIMDFFDVIDLEKYDLGSLQGSTLDYKFALQITSEIFILELIHRVVVCFFEALCLHQGTNGVGGATPGKSLLGLRVVSCETVIHIQGTRVMVWPAGDMGFGWALLRSVIKNFAMAFFFPACITMFFFPYHRTVYDILCGCIVVEDIRPEQRF